MKDPYLKPGVPCEVWNAPTEKIERDVAKYATTINGTNYFMLIRLVGIKETVFCWPYANYRPIGTEWDYAPDWAVCSTVDADGTLKFWHAPEKIAPDLSDNTWYISNEKYGAIIQMECGICPDKSRYEGDAWKTSLRMRPKWA